MKKVIALLVFIILVVSVLFLVLSINNEGKVKADPYAKNYDFEFVLKATGSDREAFMGNLTELLEGNISDFAKGDILLILGRVEGNETKICESFGYYERSFSDNPEKNALIYETLASLDCGKGKKDYLLNASEIWKSLGNEFRAELDEYLARRGFFDYKINDSELPDFTLEIPENSTEFIIGSSFFRLSEDDVLVSQADRVSRDWLSYQIYTDPYNVEILLKTFSERLTYDENELLPEIGWHEGGRISEMESSGLKHLTASGTVVKRFENDWYAPDENGIFRFFVPTDKVLYPTTRFLREDLAIITDTHGINMIVEQAVRYNASVVVGCCDNPGKIKAALYLSEKGIKTVCLTDKYLSLALGSNANILGSPPIRKEGGSVILGDRPLEFFMNETFVVMGVSGEKFALSYYDTPRFYFRRLERFVNIDVHYSLIDDFGQMDKVIDIAETYGATTIAVRVFNSDDYIKVKEWLETDKERKAVLFHSVPYPYGYKLLNEFPEQTTFDDISPEFL